MCRWKRAVLSVSHHGVGPRCGILSITGISSWASHARPAPCPLSGLPGGALNTGRQRSRSRTRQRGRWMTQVSDAPARTRAQIKERTLRTDPWWNRGRVVATLLTIWVAYATVRVFTGHWYYVPQYHYLTPFYSPCVSGECVPDSSALGHWIPAIPPIIPYAFISLPFVLGFRLSCYYYRGAYYRAFWRSPSACAVREPHATYSGETKVPLIAFNLHRFFFYMAIVISVLNTYDMVQAFRGPNGSFGI